MKTLEQHLTQYAAYHRDPRNIATHFVGIPLIVLGVGILLSRPGWNVGGLPLSAASVAITLTGLFYFRLDLALGLVMASLLGVTGWLGAVLAAQSTTVWLGAGLGTFIGGWVIQFVGHLYEGKKPAFVDDVVGLLQGPLFLVAEVAFALGLRSALKANIEKVVGPVRLRQKEPAAV
jgi:uncharacterized membrane protein YGL010W